MPDQDKSLDQSLQGLQNLQGVQSTPGIPNMPGIPTMSPETLAKLQEFLQRPGIKKYSALATNPEFTTDLMNVIQHPQLKLAGEWELGWIVFMLIFRSWWMSKTSHWFKTILISVWTFILFWVVAAIAIPTYFLNPAFTTLVKDTWRLLS